LYHSEPLLKQAFVQFQRYDMRKFWCSDRQAWNVVFENEKGIDSGAYSSASKRCVAASELVIVTQRQTDRQRERERERAILKPTCHLIAGGLFRESMAQFATDIMDDRVGLFIACPNDRANHGDGQHLYIPRTATLPFSRLPMMQFVGNLMGVAIRTQEPLPISLPPLIWKLLVCDMRTPWLTGMCQDLSLSLSLSRSLSDTQQL
jgi:hypothetical protein